MTESIQMPRRGALGRMLHGISYGGAIAGSVVMAGLVIMVTASVIGRSLFNAPVYGDFELVSMGTALSVSLFLPYCHLRRGNVIVDLFLANAPRSVRAACDIFSGLLLAAIMVLLTWRSVLGGMDMGAHHDVTMILGLPVWVIFPPLVFSLGLLAICCLYTAWQDLAELLR